MKREKIVSLVATITLLMSACGGGGGGGTPTLTYSETVSAYASEGLDTYTRGKALGEAYEGFSQVDISDGNSTDADTIDTDMASFTEAFSDYSAHISAIGTYAETTFPTMSSSIAYKELGVDTGKSIYEMNSALQTKKTECDDLKALIPSGTVDPARFAAAKAAYDQCARELMALAANEGFKIVVVETGGGAAGGAVAGGAFLYFVGGGAAALLSGPGLLVVIVGGLVGQKIATSVYEYCTSSSDKNVSPKTVSAGNYCAAASVSGVTGEAMPMNTTGGTGSLHIFVDGYAPVLISGVTVPAGQTTTVTVYPIELTDVSDDSFTEVTDASDSSATSSGSSSASSCSEVVTISAINSPIQPSPDQSVIVGGTVGPAVNNCTILYSVSGSDGYYTSSTTTTNSSGQFSFGTRSASEGVSDTVAVREAASGASASLAYSFTESSATTDTVSATVVISGTTYGFTPVTVMGAFGEYTGDISLTGLPSVYASEGLSVADLNSAFLSIITDYRYINLSSTSTYSFNEGDRVFEDHSGAATLNYFTPEITNADDGSVVVFTSSGGTITFSDYGTSVGDSLAGTFSATVYGERVTNTEGTAYVTLTGTISGTFDVVLTNQDI